MISVNLLHPDQIAIAAGIAGMPCLRSSVFVVKQVCRFTFSSSSYTAISPAMYILFVHCGYVLGCVFGDVSCKQCIDLNQWQIDNCACRHIIQTPSKGLLGSL